MIKFDVYQRVWNCSNILANSFIHHMHFLPAEMILTIAALCMLSSPSSSIGLTRSGMSSKETLPNPCWKAWTLDLQWRSSSGRPRVRIWTASSNSWEILKSGRWRSFWRGQKAATCHPSKILKEMWKLVSYWLRIFNVQSNTSDFQDLYNTLST